MKLKCHLSRISLISATILVEKDINGSGYSVGPVSYAENGESIILQAWVST